MLANTPMYLYRKLRVEPFVKSLAEAYTPTELLASVNEIEKQETRNPEDVASAYAMLVALSFKEYRQTEAALEIWRPTALTWGKQIASILRHKAVVTNQSTWGILNGAPSQPATTPRLSSNTMVSLQ